MSSPGRQATVRTGRSIRQIRRTRPSLHQACTSGASTETTREPADAVAPAACGPQDAILSVRLSPRCTLGRPERRDEALCANCVARHAKSKRLVQKLAALDGKAQAYQRELLSARQATAEMQVALELARQSELEARARADAAEGKFRAMRVAWREMRQVMDHYTPAGADTKAATNTPAPHSPVNSSLLLHLFSPVDSPVPSSAHDNASQQSTHLPATPLVDALHAPSQRPQYTHPPDRQRETQSEGYVADAASPQRPAAALDHDRVSCVSGVLAPDGAHPATAGKQKEDDSAPIAAFASVTESAAAATTTATTAVRAPPTQNRAQRTMPGSRSWAEKRKACMGATGLHSDLPRPPPPPPPPFGPVAGPMMQHDWEDTDATVPEPSPRAIKRRRSSLRSDAYTHGTLTLGRPHEHEPQPAPQRPLLSPQHASPTDVSGGEVAPEATAVAVARAGAGAGAVRAVRTTRRPAAPPSPPARLPARGQGRASYPRLMPVTLGLALRPAGKMGVYARLHADAGGAGPSVPAAVQPEAGAVVRGAARGQLVGIDCPCCSEVSVFF